MKTKGRKSGNVVDVRDIRNSGTLRLKPDTLPTKYSKIGDTSMESIRRNTMLKQVKDAMKTKEMINTDRKKKNERLIKKGKRVGR